MVIVLSRNVYENSGSIYNYIVLLRQVRITVDTVSIYNLSYYVTDKTLSISAIYFKSSCILV